MFLAILSLWSTLVPGPRQERFGVHCFASIDPSGFVGPKEKALLDSVEDLRKALVKKKTLSLVDDRNLAEITVEVLERTSERVAVGSKTQATYTGLQTKEETRVRIVLRTVMRVGEYETELVAENNPTNEFDFSGWRSLAGNIAGQVERFVKENAERLHDARAATRKR